MRAAILRRPHVAVEIEQVELDDPGSGELQLTWLIHRHRTRLNKLTVLLVVEPTIPLKW